MNRPPQRPPPPSINDGDCSLSTLTDYLYKTPYGKEDERVLNHLWTHHDDDLALSWHVQFRVWLQSTNTTTVSLPYILSKLQASLLHDSSLLMWDTDDITTYQQDFMLQHWNVVRYFCFRDIKEKKLSRQEKVDVQRIVQGIDKLVGYTEETTHNRETDYQESKGTDSLHSNEFDSWLSSRVSNLVDIVRLLQKVEQGPQWRVRRNVREMPLQQTLLYAACHYSNNSNHRRGRALLTSFLLVNNKKNDWVELAPVPSLSSVNNNNVKTVVRDYLFEGDAIPHVQQLVLALWERHLNQGDILETIQELTPWLPIEPVASRYQALLRKDNNALGDEQTEETMVRATDMLCALIGNDVEEWKEIWNDDLTETLLLPLVHTMVLNPSKHLKAYTTVCVVLERILTSASAGAIVEACPQLGWITLLFNDLPMNDEVNYVSQEVADQMKQLRACLLAWEDDTRLPPLSLYIDSALSACVLSSSEEAARTWVHHVIRTLAVYKQNDEVAMEWFRSLNSQETVNALTESLHREVCVFLWGSNEEKTSVSLSQLLAEGRDSRILLWAPLECLFAHTSDLLSSLEQMLSKFGRRHAELAAIAAGLALVIPDNLSSAFKCRDILYQYLRPFVAEGDTQFVEQIERELGQHPASLDWWNALYTDLVRNEVPIFTAVKDEEEVSVFDVKPIDAFLVRNQKRLRREDADDTAPPHAEDNVQSVVRNRKRPRQEHVHSTAPPQAEDTVHPAKSKARSRESATAVIQNLYGDTRSVQKADVSAASDVGDGTANEVHFQGSGNGGESVKDGDHDDDYNEDDDDEILLL